jgi:hypothetical protein
MQAEIIPDGDISHWRSVYEAHGSSAARKDVRATLEDLATINDAECAGAIHAVDTDTECEMLRAVWHCYRQRDADAVIPVVTFDLEKYSAPAIRQIAQLALDHLKVNTGGRPNTRKLDIEFAAWLALEYQKQTGYMPTTITDGSTPFMCFAIGQFSDIGRRSRDMTKILRDGIREAFDRPKKVWRPRWKPRNTKSTDFITDFISVYNTWCGRRK